MTTTKFIGEQYAPGLGTVRVYREKRKFRENGRTIRKNWLRKELVETEAERYIRQSWRRREQGIYEKCATLLDKMVERNKEAIHHSILLQGHDLHIIYPGKECLRCPHAFTPKLLDYVA